MADYLALRERCLCVCNTPAPDKDGNYWIGIVNHNVACADDVRNPLDVLWAKAARILRVDKAKGSYLSREMPDGTSMPPTIYLSFDNENLKDKVDLAALDYFQDKFIIIQATLSMPQPTLSSKLRTTAPPLIQSKVPAKTKKQGRASKKANRPLPTPSSNDEGGLARSVFNGKHQYPQHAPNGSMADDDVHGKKEMEDGTSLSDEDEPSDDEDALHDAEPPGEPVDPEADPQEFFSAAQLDQRTQPKQADMEFDSSYMTPMLAIKDVSRAESIVRQSLPQIMKLQEILRPFTYMEDVKLWLEQAEHVRKQAFHKRTILGVVGNTGAGKSSVLNALLEESDLLPTSGMRACTAVATEIAYNESDDPERKYIAKITFITEAEWRKELDVLMAIMSDEAGTFTASTNSEAGMALAKIQAVYPSIRSMADLKHTTMNTLLSKMHVCRNVGTTRTLSSSSALAFREAVQRYVDTTQTDRPVTKNSGPREPQLWPLIKAVKILTKARILATGAVLVDLPGVHDSNAARAAVADSYMKQCSGIWIVAPISRAVNDEAAKKLLGEQFKRQMKFDGLLSNVTFICSKTDDIRTAEIAHNLGLQKQIQDSRDETAALEARIETTKSEFKDYHDRMHELSAKFKAADAELREWYGLERSLGNGNVVFAPTTVKKRKLPESSMPMPRKRKGNAPGRSLIDDDEDDDFDMFSTHVGAPDTEDPQPAAPLTMTEISVKLRELQAEKEESARLGMEYRAHRKELKQDMERMEKEREALSHKDKAICIAARNEWSRDRIQQDYAQGIKELDEEFAEEEDEDSFDPQALVKDYDDIANSLPVFCVSSKAFQILAGRFEDEGKTSEFTTPEQTEVPQLMAHCIKMTEGNRIMSARAFLESWTKLLISLNLWSANDGCGAKLSDAELEQQRTLLRTHLASLTAAFQRAGETTAKKFQHAVVTRFDKPLGKSKRMAVKSAKVTAAAWGAPEAQGGLGLKWQTYKAIVRRDGGPFDATSGIRYDFNADLSGHFQGSILWAWDMFFTGTVPKLAKDYAVSMNMTLDKFHSLAINQGQARGVNPQRINALEQKLERWHEDFAQHAKDLNSVADEVKREINHEMEPYIKNEMLRAYAKAKGFSGKGCIKKMKEHMATYVSKKISKIYLDCSKHVFGLLEDMREKLLQTMDQHLDDFMDEVRRDYMNAITGVQLSDEKMTKSERRMRANLHKAVYKTNLLLLELAETHTIDLLHDEDLAEPDESDRAGSVIQSEQNAEEASKEPWLDVIDPDYTPEEPPAQEEMDDDDEDEYEDPGDEDHAEDAKKGAKVDYSACFTVEAGSAGKTAIKAESAEASPLE